MSWNAEVPDPIAAAFLQAFFYRNNGKPDQASAWRSYADVLAAATSSTLVVKIYAVTFIPAALLNIKKADNDIN